MDTSKKTTVPTWVWAVPVIFGLPGGFIAWVILRKRKDAGWLIWIGLILSFAANMLFLAISQGN